MIDEILITWMKPKHWSDRTRFLLNQSLDINGYKVPSGFITDGGSIPWGMRNTFSPVGKGFPAFCAHDKKCVDKEDRKQADKELYRDLKSCGVNRGRAWAMYKAVRAYATLARIK